MAITMIPVAVHVLATVHVLVITAIVRVSVTTAVVVL